MNKLAPCLTTLWIVAFSTACVGTDVGNPPDDRRITATLEFETFVADAPTDAPVPGVAESRALLVAGGVDIEQLWFTIDEIVVTSASDCSESGERVVPGPFFVDLLEGRVYPAAPVLTQRPESFCAIRISLGESKDIPSSAPAELAGKSLWLSARREGEALSISVTNPRMLRYGGGDFAIEGDDGDSLRFVDVFDPSRWFDDIALTPNVPVELDDLAREAEVAAFWSAFHRSSRVVPDADDDGAIVEAEFDLAVALPIVP